MRITAVIIIVSLIMSATPVAAQQETPIWKNVAASIPLGSRVKAETLGGKHYTGTLMQAGADAILIKRNTRLPEPAVSIPYSEVAKLERDHGGGGASVAKAIGIGLGAGAGIFFGLLLIAFATIDD